MSFIEGKEKQIDVSPQNVQVFSRAGMQSTADAQIVHGIYARFGKRVLDIFLVLIAAPAVLLVCIPMALMIMMDGGSPFYKQARVGR
ncbi:sugar transferase, partial [Thalassovita mediterranea]